MLNTQKIILLRIIIIFFLIIPYFYVPTTLVEDETFSIVAYNITVLSFALPIVLIHVLYWAFLVNYYTILNTDIKYEEYQIGIHKIIIFVQIISYFILF